MRADLISLAAAETVSGSTVTMPVSNPTGSTLPDHEERTDQIAPAPHEPLMSAPTATSRPDVQPVQPKATTAPEDKTQVPAEAGQETIVDEVHTGISKTIQGTATWMDSFFGNRRYESELNRSYVRFRYNVFLERGSDMMERPEFQIRMVLPQLQEKTHLILSGTPRETTTQFSAVESNSENSPITAPEDRNVSAAVEQTFKQSVKENFSVKAGLQVHNFTPAIMLAPRYRLLIPLDSWNLRFVEEVMWRSNFGWESRATTDLERHLPHDLFFRATNDWIWVEHTLGYLYDFSFTLAQPIDSRRGIDYEWINVFQTDPVNELTEVTLRVRYRTQVWREWLYFEVAPQYRFPRDQAFKPLAGVLFRLDMIFGDYKDNH